MMCNKTSENGYAFLMVLFVLFILCATYVAVSAGLTSQGNVAAMNLNTSAAIAKAEDGLAIGMDQLRKNNNIDNGFNLKSDDWAIKVTYNPTTQTLQSEASKGRFKRKVAIDLTIVPSTITTTTEVLAAKYNMYSGGQIKVDSGTLKPTGQPQVTTFSVGSLTVNGGSVESHDAVLTSNSTIDPGGLDLSKRITLTPNSTDQVPFPELDFTKLTADSTLVISNANGTITVGKTTYTNFREAWERDATIKLKNNINIQVKGDFTMDTGDINPNIPYNIVFTRASGFSGNYKITFSGNTNINGSTDKPVNLLSDGGSFHFLKNINTNGLVYTNCDLNDPDHDLEAVHINNATNFKVTSIICKGAIHLNNGNFEGLPTSGLSEMLAAYQKPITVPGDSTVTYANWHEVNN